MNQYEYESMINRGKTQPAHLSKEQREAVADHVIKTMSAPQGLQDLVEQWDREAGLWEAKARQERAAGCLEMAIRCHGKECVLLQCRDQLQAMLDKLRTAVADYMRSEGCSCCSDYDTHKEDALRIAALLNAPPYSDGSGANFSQFETPKPTTKGTK